MYNLYNFEAKFKNFLNSENISRVTIRNYLSDMRFFSGWATNYTTHTSLDEILSSSTFLEYKEYLAHCNFPHKTINRRLSTLRKMCAFFRKEGILNSFPESKLTNITNTSTVQNADQINVIKQFQAHILTTMEENEANKYINDINELINYK
jgi:site-specific recombinase XerD